MKYSIVLLSLFVSVNLYAESCIFDYNSENTKLAWTAFKTPKKVGVGAKFDTFKISALKANSIVNVVKTAVFTIDAASVNSGNDGRDEKIRTFFFSTMLKGPVIMGHVGKVVEDKGKKGVFEVWFDINGVRKPINMDYTVDKNTIVLTGTIDVLDFSLDGELAAINNACKTLHQGKTWSDVDLTLEASFTKVCK